MVFGWGTTNPLILLDEEVTCLEDYKGREVSDISDVIYACQNKEDQKFKSRCNLRSSHLSIGRLSALLSPDKLLLSSDSLGRSCG